MSEITGLSSRTGGEHRARRRIALAVGSALLAGGLVLAATITAPPAEAAGISVVTARGGGGNGGGGGGSTSEVPWGSVGDSFAAGVGAGSTIDSSCDRRSVSYPGLLNADTDKQLVSFLACSGADTADVTAQARMLSKKVKVVTVTVGGNDVGFADVMQACFVFVNPTTCESRITAGAAAAQSDAFEASLAGVITTIKSRVPQAKIIVTGYPLLFDPSTSYTYGVRVNAETVTLNNVIEQVAVANGATFVDVETAFSGCGIGSVSPCINDFRWLSSNSFHPNASGYAAYAAEIRKALP